ncbi:hypothetical protein BDW_04335 [Bdellovibrio bacteriovorus W]|nr:hypothetical protein BDW_04335 [Bdellovibrio bacteriovorus W]
MRKLFTLFITSLSLLGCATNSKSRLALTGVGFGTGAIIGAASAPRDERPEMHAVYWGSIVGLAAALAANYYYSDESSLDVLRLENEKLKAQMDIFQSGAVKELVTSRVREQEVKSGSKKVNIKVYKVDKWIDHDEQTKMHVDQMMEITPIKDRP